MKTDPKTIQNHENASWNQEISNFCEDFAIFPLHYIYCAPWRIVGVACRLRLYLDARMPHPAWKTGDLHIFQAPPPGRRTIWSFSSPLENRHCEPDTRSKNSTSNRSETKVLKQCAIVEGCIEAAANAKKMAWALTSHNQRVSKHTNRKK